jgi:hypothetical protein
MISNFVDQGRTEDETHLNDQNDFEDKYLTDFLEKTGAFVIPLATGLWYSRGVRVVEPVIMNGPTEISDSSRQKLWDGGALFLRYPVSVGSGCQPSYIHVVNDKKYDLDSLRGNQRKETRRALKLCEVRRIEIEYLLEHGIEIIIDTYHRQERYLDDQILNSWKKYLKLSRDNPLFEAWGAFVGKQLGAFRVDFTYRGGFYGEILFNRSSLLKYQVMNALMFVSTREVIRRPNVDCVSYGIRATFGESASLLRFKESMGYKRVEVEERVDLNPKIRLLGRIELLNKIAKRIVSPLLERSDKAKRFYSLLDMIREQRLK